MNDAETLKRLIRLWAVILDTDPKTVMRRAQEALKIETFENDPEAQKRAIDYLRNKLEGGK